MLNLKVTRQVSMFYVKNLEISNSCIDGFLHFTNDMLLTVYMQWVKLNQVDEHLTDTSNLRKL